VAQLTLGAGSRFEWPRNSDSQDRIVGEWAVIFAALACTPGGAMRALTVRQPRAWAIIHAGKDIENRSWTNKHVTGTIAVHAGSGLDPLNKLPRGAKRPQADELVHGAIIGVVDVVGVVAGHRSKWFRGPLGWKLHNPRPLTKPIPCTGKLGLWRVPSSVRRAIDQQLGPRV
jgi:hypothetical protein